MISHFVYYRFPYEQIKTSCYSKVFILLSVEPLVSYLQAGIMPAQQPWEKNETCTDVSSNAKHFVQNVLGQSSPNPMTTKIDRLRPVLISCTLLNKPQRIYYI